MTGMRYPKILKPSAGGDARAEIPLSFTKLGHYRFIGLPLLLHRGNLLARGQ